MTEVLDMLQLASPWARVRKARVEWEHHEHELRREAADAERRRDELQTIFDTTADGLLTYDRDGRIRASNPRCAELLGFSAEEMCSTAPHVLAAAIAGRTANPERYLASVKSHFAVPDAPYSDHLELQAPRRRVLLQRSAPIVHHGRVGGRVFTYTDITAESDLVRTKSELVGIASHELRTPLTSVRGALQLALADDTTLAALPAESRELLEISLASTERLTRLVGELLTLAKIEAGRMPMQVVPQQVSRLVHEAVSATQPHARAAEIALVSSIDNLGLYVEGDADHLVQVLSNLLSNAIKFSPASSRVLVVARGVGPSVQIAVEDEGPGVAPEGLGRLFEPFSHVGTQPPAADGGTGLGLATCRAIVEQHGGRIWVEPRHPRGSRFLVALPAAEQRERISA